MHLPPRLLTQLYPVGPGAAPSMNTVLLRAEVLERIQGWENAFPGAYEDQAMLVKAYLSTPVLVSTVCCDRYRIRPGSVMERVYATEGYDAARLRFFTLAGQLSPQGGGDRPTGPHPAHRSTPTLSLATGPARASSRLASGSRADFT